MARAPRWLSRPELEQRLDGALAHRLTTIVAAAGHGKSALLTRWSADVGAAMHRLGPEDRDLGVFVGHVVGALRACVPTLPDELTTVLAAPLGPGGADDPALRAAGLASELSEVLHRTLRRDLVLILDEVGWLPHGGPPAAFLDALLRGAPHRFHLVLASRHPPPFSIERLRARDRILAITAADLTLDAAEVRRWAAELFDGDTSLVDRITERTGGWPIAVVEVLTRLATLPSPAARAAALDVVPEAADHDALVVAAFDALTPDEQELVLLATALPSLSPALADALGLCGDRLAEVHRYGLLLDQGAGGSDTYRASRAARAVLGDRTDRSSSSDARVRRAAGWFLDTGRRDLALRTLLERGPDAELDTFLTAHGDALVADGDAATVLRAMASTDERFAESHIGRRLRGLAHHALGRWDEARRLLASVADDGHPDAVVAWRLGLIHHLRGEIDDALACYASGRDAEPPADAVICAAMYATARWLRGERDACAEAADDALERALDLGEDGPLAAAHTVLAMLAALDGDRRANDAHYRRALEHAERAGDTFQLIRIRANRASHHNEEGAYAEALTELEGVSRLAELTGFSPFVAVALSNRAEALIHLGRLEEAAADAADAVATWRALGSRLVVYALEQVASVQRLRGDRAGATATYTEALAEAEAASDAQGLVSSLVALAELRCDEDPEDAMALARRALSYGGLGYVAACLAAARAAMAGGDRRSAREHLERARREATVRRDAPALAAATELQASLDGDEALAGRAAAAWRRLGDPIAACGAELTQARLAATDPTGRSAAGEVATRVRAELHAIGCRVFDDRIASLEAPRDGGAPVTVAVQTLGGFRVSRDGVPMSRSDWQSRKARLLLMLLASHGGRATPRDWLSEQLWPEVPSEVADRRLRVLISTVRGLLDPGRQHPSDHLVVSERDAVRLDLRHLDLDVVRFLDHVDAAARSDAEGRVADAVARWRAAEAAYTGQFCPEELYAEWSVRPREELRAAYVQTCARLATVEAAAGNHDEAVRRWLRLLESDPYDERAHLALVEVLLHAGRRSEARRRYRTYLERVRELGLEAAPFPAS